MLCVPCDLPFAQNLRFVGREKELDQIHTFLSPPSKVDSSTVILLCGIGGVGKSQIALEYAYTRGKDCFSVFWIDASSQDALRLDLIKIAQRVISSLLIYFPEDIVSKDFGLRDAQALQDQDLGSIPPHQQQQIITAVKNWLAKSSTNQWLLIFDNYDSVESFDLQGYFPAAKHKRIIVTSRRRDLQNCLPNMMDITSLDDDSARQLLLHGNENTPKLLGSGAVTELLRELGNFPLAISQANAYITVRKISVKEFLRLHKKKFKDVMGQKPRTVRGYNHVVVTTWEISFADVKAENAIAAEILLLCAFVSNNNIHEELIRTWEFDDLDGRFLLPTA